MRGLRFILAFFAVILVVAAALYFARAPLAGWAVRRAMAAQGLESPQADVTALSVDHIRIENFEGGPPGGRLSVDSVEVDFNWREALNDKRVKSIRAGPGRASIILDEAGGVKIAGMERRGGEGGGALPFDRLTLNDLTLDIKTPEGAALGVVNAVYDVDGAGEAHMIFTADRAGLKTVVENARAVLEVALSPTGAAKAEGSFTGDILSDYGTLRGADLVASADGASWKDIAAGQAEHFTGRADISLGEARIDTAGAPALARFNERAELIGGPISELVLSGDLSLIAEEGAIMIVAGEAPIAAEADTGARAILDTAMDAPFYVYDNGRASVAGVLSLRGGDVSATAKLDAYQTGEGWYFSAPIRLGEVSITPLRLSDASAVISGTVRDGRANFETTTSGDIRKASLGRFSISNAPVSVTVLTDADFAAKTATLRLPEDNCARADKLSLKIAEQDMDAMLKGAQICAAEAPLAVINFESGPITDFSADVISKSASYRLGQTRLSGRPPSLSVNGRYLPAENSTTAKARATGGSVVLNDLLRFDQLSADIEFGLEKDGMTITADASKVRLTEYGELAKVAPIMARGRMRLADDIANFTYEASTPSGVALGKGSGVHNIKTARGEASFDFDRLEFAPGGLQPDRLAPVLKGIIGLSTGAADGAAKFSWDRDGVNSSADITFENITFRGPGLTVTQTIGVNGDVGFSSLWPVATKGAQTITIGGVDFGALQLENGEVVFDMPGDDTLLVERAIFPWFGGQMGVREAKATFTGGEATAPLRVEGVDLKQILDYVDVEGLSGEGTLNGVLPLVVENSRASFVDGRLTAEGPGRISYVGRAGEAAAEAGGEARIAFDVLRDLQYKTLTVAVDGPLDGRLDFLIQFEGTGAVSVNNVSGRVPVKYNITLDAALLELLNQANLSRNLEMQIEQAVQEIEN